MAIIISGPSNDILVNGSSVVTEAEASTTNATLAPLASPTFTGTVTLPSTTSIGAVSSTELGYLDGVTSSVQTQINTLVAINDAAKDVVQNSQTTGYTLALADRSRSIDVSTGGITITVPLNSAVAFPIGATVSITNLAATAITVSSSATLRQAGTANTGSRTLAAYCMATLRKVATDTWFISGAGLS